MATPKAIISGSLLILYLCAAGPPSKLSQKDEKLVENACGVALLDPYSAHYDFDFVTSDSSGTFVCGWANAKNAYGAYTGRQRFTVMITHGKAGACEFDDPALEHHGSEAVCR